MSEVGANLAMVRQRIAAAAARAGRAPSSIQLIAVAKTKSAALVGEAVTAGVRDIGENYVQEASAKRAAVGGDVCWHMIGRLQRNKAARALEIFQLIHSLDSVALAEALARHAAERDVPARVLVEVNLGGERSKTGIAPAALPALLERVRGPHLAIEGLMTIPPPDVDPRPYFAQLRGLRDAEHLRELSMGMSDDFETAIEEGATMIRVGRAIFGAR